MTNDTITTTPSPTNGTPATNSEDLHTVVNDMLTRIDKVAELVDSVFPHEGVGQGVKECGQKLREHIQALSMNAIKAAGIDILDEDNIHSLDTSNLTAQAIQECAASLKQVKAMRETNPTDASFESLSRHTVSLLSILVK